MGTHADVQDLNAILPARKKILLGDVTYEIPGDMPMEVYLRTQIAFMDDTPEGDAAAQLKQAFVDLLTFFNPDDQDARRTVEINIRAYGVRTIIKLLSAIYQDAEADEAESEAASGESSEPEIIPATETAIPTTTGTSQTESSPIPNSPKVTVGAEPESAG